MSALHDGLYTYLSGLSGITDLLGATPRLYPQRAPTSATAPYVTYQRTAADHHHQQRAAAGLNQATVQFDCYAGSSTAAQELSEAVRAALDGIGTTTWGLLAVKQVTLLNESDAWLSLEDGSENGLFRVTMDFSIWHAESIPTF